MIAAVHPFAARGLAVRDACGRPRSHHRELTRFEVTDRHGTAVYDLRVSTFNELYG